MSCHHTHTHTLIWLRVDGKMRVLIGGEVGRELGRKAAEVSLISKPNIWMRLLLGSPPCEGPFFSFLSIGRQIISSVFATSVKSPN